MKFRIRRMRILQNEWRAFVCTFEWLSERGKVLGVCGGCRGNFLGGL